jgi:bis(5'-nucleosyl)-tetraphosphatase (symmetrical)
LQHMYGHEPRRWQPTLTGFERWRYIINAFTRIRFCNDNGELDFSEKGDLIAGPSGYQPWFCLEKRKNRDLNIIFGHWAALYNQWDEVIKLPGIFPVDSGCVWGNCLTAFRLEDRQRYSVSCQK